MLNLTIGDSINFMPLPAFTDDGLLPPGTYQLTFQELKKSHLVTGASSRNDEWNSLWRLKLVENAEILVTQLWEAGVQKVFLDGSFVEDKCRPGDIDGYYDCDSLENFVKNISPTLRLIDTIWDWRELGKPRTWIKYKVEFYPHYGQLAGIPDEFGNQQTFPAAFRKTRDTYQSKGIIQVIKEKKQ